MTPDTPTKTAGQVAAEAYHRTGHWPFIPTAIREGWERAASAVIAHHEATRLQREKDAALANEQKIANNPALLSTDTPTPNEKEN